MEKLGLFLFVIVIASAGFVAILAAQKRFVNGLYSIFLVSSFLALLSYTNNWNYIIGGGLILGLITLFYIYLRFKNFSKQ